MTFNSEVFEMDFYKEYMALVNSKPLVLSTSFWGGLIALLTMGLEQLPDVINQVLPILSPQTGAIVSAVGGLIAIYGRATAKKAVKGVFSSPVK